MTIVNGILELVTSLSCGGDSIYTIDVEDSSGNRLYDLLGEYEGKKVKLIIEESNDAK